MGTQFKLDIEVSKAANSANRFLLNASLEVKFADKAFRELVRAALLTTLEYSLDLGVNVLGNIKILMATERAFVSLFEAAFRIVGMDKA